MKYSGFIIRKEHMFLRNIFSAEEIKKSEKLKTLENYYEAFGLFLTTCAAIQLATSRRYSSFDEIDDENLIKFCNNYCEDIADFEKMKEE